MCPFISIQSNPLLWSEEQKCAVLRCFFLPLATQQGCGSGCFFFKCTDPDSDVWLAIVSFWASGSGARLWFLKYVDPDPQSTIRSRIRNYFFSSQAYFYPQVYFCFLSKTEFYPGCGLCIADCGLWIRILIFQNSNRMRTLIFQKVGSGSWFLSL